MIAGETFSSSEETPTFRFTHWPTAYPTVTQAYDDNPAYYARWGLSGHEGIDIQAAAGSPIFAVAPGTVVRVVAAAEGHPYGNAVYVEHGNGYRTAYAHLSHVGVGEGQTVAGGQELGQAGETGNAQGPHLHLTLYKAGASERGETRQPRDIVDPTPFLEPLRQAAWDEPQPPLVPGWGWADSIERHDHLGRVSNSGGINLRAEPRQDAARKGLVPRGTIVRVTGERRNNYFPIEASAAALQLQPPDQAGGTLGYAFVNFDNSAGDYSNLQPGREFSATWTVRNKGTVPWRDDFRLSYVEATTPETEDHARTRLGAAPSYRLGELIEQEEVAPGSTVDLSLTLVAPDRPGWYASHWQLQTPQGHPVGRPLWLRINVGGAPLEDPRPLESASFQPGMNINPDAHAPDVERLRGLHWVRFPYKAAAKHRSVDEAFRDQYRSLIQAYTNAGINCLLILNQETAWGNAPWENGNWEAYANSLARAAGRVAELCAPFGEMVAYQIWNEEDSDPSNKSAIGVSPENFALILSRTAQAIRQAVPTATIVLGGLNSAPAHAVAYLEQVRAALDGDLAVDALAYHPYGRYVKHDPFHNKQFGTIQEALRIFEEAFPDLPLWITEMGVAGDTPIGPEHYEQIANYMGEIVAEIANKHRQQVPVLIWFAWSDLMRNAGITTVQGEMKPHLGKVFREFVSRGQPDQGEKAVSLEPQADARFKRFSTSLADHNAVPAGSAFTNQWYFENTGNTSWGEGYRLVYAPQGKDADPLLAATAFPLADVATPAAAEPGEEVAIALTMSAPAQAGRYYRSRWELRDPQDKAFGSLYAEITTVTPSTVGSGAQQAGMAFVADHTIPDDTRFPAGESFNKQWRVRNSGARQWGNGFRLVFIEGDLAMARGVASHMVPKTARGEEAILTIPMSAPLPQQGQATTYQSVWRLQDDRGNFFGNAIWARIVSLPPGVNATLGRFADPGGWYSQIDPGWQQETLGHGQQSIGAWGCLLTCQAMMLSACGLAVNPAELNRRLRPLGDDGFRGSDVQFIAPTRVLAGLEQGKNVRSWPDDDIPWTEATDQDPIARIDQALAANHVVLAQVDRTPNNAFYHANTEQHWVILVCRTPDGGDYLMLDPMTPPDQLQNQPSSLMRKYGNPAPSRPHAHNLRDAIKSALIYRFHG